MERQTTSYATGSLEVEHRYSREHKVGDTMLTATPGIDTFNVGLSETRGRDHDNRDSWDDVEIDLNVEEARELHLLLHMWLEKKG